MKRLITVGLMLILSGCGGGYDDMDAARPGGGIGNTGSDNNQPGNPNGKKNWQYSSVADGSRVFALRAITYSLNTYQRPDNKNLAGSSWVKLERIQSPNGVVSDTVAIFVDSNTSCAPSCDVRMSFDGGWATYRMQNTSNGILTPINGATEITLFKKFTSSNRATVSLPIIGLAQPFDANFDLSGYDLKRMKF